MSKLKRALKLLMPPIFVKLAQKMLRKENAANFANIQNTLCYYGDFSSWQEAKNVMTSGVAIIPESTGGGIVKIIFWRLWQLLFRRSEMERRNLNGMVFYFMRKPTTISCFRAFCML